MIPIRQYMYHTSTTYMGQRSQSTGGAFALAFAMIQIWPNQNLGCLVSFVKLFQLIRKAHPVIVSAFMLVQGVRVELFTALLHRMEMLYHAMPSMRLW